MPGPVGASSIPTPDPFKLIQGLQDQMNLLRAEVEVLKKVPSASARLVARNAVMASAVAMPEDEIPAAVTRILASMEADGWLRLIDGSQLADALKEGVPEAALIDHFHALITRYGAHDAAFGGHVANLILDQTFYPYLINGKGIGFAIWMANADDQKNLFGYSQDDIDALATLNPEKVIEDYDLFVTTGGAQGWRPRANDPRGRSSDDDLFGEPKP